ncbi:hypothetical protein IE81DRAFT_347524 [Ceraceosorus guamensis]|uniref:Uncharacterized protein n=1 Tax=Ceraceosorus guamensis TaxID=1522189 RepID=A0A316W3U6_9BASI|nr:hypothetical protein IE81DRAFT_347524 [Ceraceosorus guamensis]PWN42265.1 hypothetical protein IE81DRAFT_347524 [Ceraceosorus guamensis]
MSAASVTTAGTQPALSAAPLKNPHAPQASTQSTPHISARSQADSTQGAASVAGRVAPAMPLGARAAPDAPSGSGRPAVGATAETGAAKERTSLMTVLFGVNKHLHAAGALMSGLDREWSGLACQCTTEEIEQRHSLQLVAAARKAREELLDELKPELTLARAIQQCKSACDEQWKDNWRSRELKLRSEFSTERVEHTKQEAELRHQCDLKIRRERHAMKKEWSRWEKILRRRRLNGTRTERRKSRVLPATGADANT